MRKKFISIGRHICRVIDFFYPPFRKYMTLQFFRYGFTGVVNVGFSLVLYFFIYNFVLRQQVLPLGFFTFSSHIGSLVITFPVSTFFGFLLQKYVTFSNSKLSEKTQLFRYSTVFLINLVINYFGLKILVDVLDFWPTPSNMIISIMTILLSFFSQKHYTFETTTDSSELSK